MTANFSDPSFKSIDRTKRPPRDHAPKPCVLARTKFIKPPKLPEINEDVNFNVERHKNGGYV